jgi:hypothetical protein
VRLAREKLIIDTDIGPDCDDAGALACAHALQSDGFCRLLAVTHCTSNPYGAGCADAINNWYGRGDIPVGTLKQPGFLSGPECMKYNRYIAENYPNRYPGVKGAPDAMAVMRQTLAGEPDGSVVICAIGPLNNMANLLRSRPDEYSPLDGKSLMAAKLKRLVVMGGGWEGPEWNFQMDPASAAFVCAEWPVEIWFSTFDVGATVVTGAGWDLPPGRNPICDAYRLHSPCGRMSWDLTAVWAAVMGAAPLFNLSEPGTMAVNSTGANVWLSSPGGKHRFLVKNGSDDNIAGCLDGLMKRGNI